MTKVKSGSRPRARDEDFDPEVCVVLGAPDQEVSELSGGVMDYLERNDGAYEPSELATFEDQLEDCEQELEDSALDIDETTGMEGGPRNKWEDFEVVSKHYRDEDILAFTNRRTLPKAIRASNYHDVDSVELGIYTSADNLASISIHSAHFLVQDLKY